MFFNFVFPATIPGTPRASPSVSISQYVDDPEKTGIPERLPPHLEENQQMKKEEEKNIVDEKKFIFYKIYVDFFLCRNFIFLCRNVIFL